MRQNLPCARGLPARTSLRMRAGAICRLTNLGQSAVAAGLGLVFLWTLALVVSPELHLRVHSDAAQAEHSCVVTLISSGNYDRVAPPVHVPAPIEPTLVSQAPA